MAVLGFDLGPLRSAIAELGQGVRQGAQQAPPGGPGGDLPGGGDYLGYLAHLAPPPAADFRPPQAAPQAGPGDYLGQLGQLATSRGAPDFMTSTFAALGQLGTGGPGQFMADLAALADKFTAQKAAAVQTIGSGVGKGAAAAGATSGGTGGYTGTGTASDNAGITGQKVDQFIASKFANSPLVGKGQLILDYANARGVSVPEAVGIFWKESGMGTTAGPGWNIAGLGGAGNFAQYATIDDAIRGAIDNLASDQYRGKSVQDHIGYWFVGPQRYAQSGLNADDGTGGRNGTVGDYLSNFIAPTYAALGAPYNQTGAPTRQAAGAGGGGGDWGAGLIGTPYVMGGLRGHPDAPQQGLDCSEFTAYVWGQKGVTLPWNAQQQYNNTARVDPGQLQPGDLVFFQGTDPNDPDYVTHVGIYVGGGKMINAQDNGVQYADLSSPYWQQHLAGYGRVAATSGGGTANR